MAVAIAFEHVTYTYQAGTPMAHTALTDVSLTVPDRGYLAIIGHTGSGKSTLIQQLNALLKPTSGTIKIDEFTITPETTNAALKPLRQHVGMVFQFPENQLFEETVRQDIAFGPKNFGMAEADALALADEMLTTVGLDQSYAERSPFELSGGQMRRVAIAGVLAMQPKVLVLDEPTAGLDPQGRQEMMRLFARLHQEQGLTIVLVTHQMEDVAQYAEQVAVMHEGRLMKFGTPADVFSNREWLQDHQLDVPQAAQFARRLRDRGLTLPKQPLTADQLADYLAQQWAQRGQIMSNFIFGRYLPLDSVVHRLDPRAKLMLSFCYIIVVFLANNIWSYAILIAFTVGAILSSKISLGFFLKGIRPLLWLIVFTVVLQLLFSPAGGHTYFHWAFINVTQDGLINAGYIFVRFLLIIMMSTLLTLSTQPLDIATGLASLMKPLRWVKVPVDTLAMMLSIALRFVPTLMDEATKIMNAQRARGVDFGEGGLFKQAKSLIPLMVPLFMSAFNRAEDLSTAMEARGYQDSEHRSQYRILTWQRRDTVTWLLFLLGFVAILIFRHW
ncbi:Cobalt import ATP-binding protein CbiO 1 [Levilactobacillus brevis]|nr:Cobalt import ATP-binding protein CbiO 1 [Levilactobacillus brevis]